MHYTIILLPVIINMASTDKKFEKSHYMLQVSQRQIHNNILNILSVTAEIITAAMNATRAHYTHYTIPYYGGQHQQLPASWYL